MGGLYPKSTLMTFWRSYLQTLIPLLFLFGGYQAIVVPLLEPKPRASKSKWVATNNPSTSETQWWEHYFVEGAWQRKSPLIIEREQCILLYQEREQITDTRWRFKPLTIVIPQGSEKGGKRAIFIENPRGAEIQFKSAFDWTAGHPPPVINGQLLGDIKIYSPPDPSSGQGEMLIETRDMRIDKRQIWTDKQIKMKLGDSELEGRYLSIYMDQDLLSDAPTTSPPTDSPFNGLDYLQLIYVDKVHLGLQPGGLWPSDRIPNAKQLPAYAKLDCRGRFVFQFHQSMATFMDGVHMEHHVEGMPVDTFDCNELKLNLGWSAAKTATQVTTPAASSSQTSSQWKLNRLEATGLPGLDSNDQSRWIKLNAPGMQSEAYGQHLVMDFVNGMVSLSNVLPGTAPRNSSRVFLKRESFQVSSPQVQYQNPGLINTDNTIADKRLGWVLADGIGSAQMESENENWSLRWSKRLVIRPHEDRDLIMIEGGANISSTQRGRFVAEKLNMWVTPVTPLLAERLRPHYPDGNIPDFVPELIQADGDVMVHSEELNAQVQSMAVRFSFPDITEPPIRDTVAPNASIANQRNGSTQGTGGAGPSSGLVMTPATPPLSPPPSLPGAALPNGMPIPTPTLKTSPSSLGLSQRPVKKSSPINVTGNKLDATVSRMGNMSTIDSLTLEGNFTLTRDQLTDETQWPLTARGDKLVLLGESKDITNIHLVGTPAKISVGTGWVEANELQLSQTEQLFWIDHPGELMIPVEALQDTTPSAPTPSNAIPTLLTTPNGSRSDRNDPSNTSVRWLSAPRVQWGERMTFDGRIARFGGGVALDCKMQSAPETIWHMTANASTMTLDLANRIPLRFQQMREGQKDPTRATVKPELQIVRLDGNVDIRAAQTDLRGNRKSTENLQVPKIEFNMPTKTWIGYGPSQLWSRRLGNSNPISPNSLSPMTSLIQSNPAERLGSNNLQCLHLTFLGRMEGSVGQRIVSFYDKIDALLSPILTWEDSIDVRKSETLATNQTRLWCDQLNLFDSASLSYNQSRTASSNGTWEIDALGNARLASKTESGDVIIDASRLGYAALNDSVRIDGTQRRGATIRRIPNGTSPAQAEELQVSSASMQLKTGQLEAQIKRIEGTLPPEYQRPGQNSQIGPTGPGGASPTSPNGPVAPALPSPRDFNPFQPRNGRP